MSELIAYADVSDVQAQTGQTYTQAEQTRITKYCSIVSDRLRQYAINVGKNLDQEILAGNVLQSVVKSITVDIVVRCISTPVETEYAPLSQFSQSALGYSFSGTYLNAGGGVFIKNSELAALGLRRQRYGTIEFYDPRNNGQPD